MDKKLWQIQRIEPTDDEDAWPSGEPVDIYLGPWPDEQGQPLLTWGEAPAAVEG